jgi:hypothetical protein
MNDEKPGQVVENTAKVVKTTRNLNRKERRGLVSQLRKTQRKVRKARLRLEERIRQAQRDLTRESERLGLP